MIRRPPAFCALLLVASVSGGCVSRLTKRHRAPRESSDLTIEAAGADRTSLSLTALTIDDPKTRKSVFDLDGRGQSSLVTELGKHAKDGGALATSVRVDLTPTSEPPSRLDSSSFKRRIVANLMHRPYAAGEKEGEELYLPADRVVWSEVEVTLVGEQPFEIRGYDKVDTGYETVDLGKLTRTANFSLTGTAEASGTVGQARSSTDAKGTTRDLSTGAMVGGSVAGTVGETLTEEVQLRKRYVALAAAVENGGKSLRLVREGAAGIDLTGAAAIDVLFHADKVETTQVFSIAPATHADGTNGFTVTRRMKVVPKVTELRLCGEATSIIRHVARGAHTVREGDDRVVHQRTETKRVQVDIDLGRQFVFVLEVTHKDKSGKTTTESLWLGSPTLTAQQGRIASEAEAQLLAGWMLANATNLAAFEKASRGIRLLGEAGSELGTIVAVVVQDRALDEDSTLAPCGEAEERGGVDTIAPRNHGSRPDPTTEPNRGSPKSP